MWKTLRQNKVVVLIALGIFLISTSTLLIFLDHNKKEGLSDELKTNVLNNAEEHSNVNSESFHDDSNNVSQELHYRKLLNEHKNPILVLDLDGTVNFASDQLLNKLEYEKEELLGKSFLLIFHQDDLPLFLTAFSEILKTQSAVNTIGPYRLKTKNGDYQYHIGYAAPLIQGGKMNKILMVTKSIEDKMRDKDQKKYESGAQKNDQH